MKCPECGLVKKDVFTKSWEDIIKCEECDVEMNKIPAVFSPSIFPSEGIFLEHVSPEGKRFHSKQEMKDYAKKHDLELGALD